MASKNANHDESAPLLGSRQHDIEAEPAPAPAFGQPLKEHDERTTAQRLRILLPCIIILACYLIGSGMIDISLNQISEAIICRKVFGTITDPSSDPRCKETQVQSELALINGWEITFGMIPGLLLGVPFGLAADKYGRRVILTLSTFASAVYGLAVIMICRYPDVFPLRLRWLAPVFLLIGGGATTINTMVYTIVADVSTKAYRSTAFLYVATALTVCSLITGPLTYVMMKIAGAWYTICFGLALVVLAVPIAASLPETRSAAIVKQAEAAAHTAVRNPTIAKDDLWSNMRHQLRSMRETVSVISRTLFVDNIVVGILLFSTVFTALGKSVVIMLLQYMSVKFGWSWAKAGLLTSIKDITSVSLTAVILPAVSQFLLKTGMAPLIKDWWILRVSAIIGVVGSLAMGLAPTVPLFISAMVFNEFGCGLQAALRAIIITLVDQTQTALVMTVMGMFFTVSEMVVGPLMAETFKLGMNLGGVWVGMPYIASAAMLSITTVLVTLVPIGRSVAK